MIEVNKPIQYYQVDSGRLKMIDAEIIVETPVSLTVNGETWLSFMCTPIYLDAMAIGFLFNEGLIQSIDDIASVRVCPEGDNVDVWLRHSVDKPATWRRTSGCTGGLTSVEEDLPNITAPDHKNYNVTLVTPAQVGNLIDQLLGSQDLYRKSGGVHTSALSDGQQVRLTAEDLGRHNTLDKLAGRCLLEMVNLPRRILLTTGRISSEMLQKAARLGATVVISRSSPSSLSIQMAERWGITLIGYARRNSFKVYTHPERILSTPEDDPMASPRPVNCTTQNKPS